MGTLTIDRPAPFNSQFCHVEWNPNESITRSHIRSALPKRKSSNPFFFRNNPHPSKVRHIKGLLGHPVCAVLDAGYKEAAPNILTKPIVKRETFVPGVGLVTLQPTWVDQLQTLTQKLSRMKPDPVSSRLPSRHSTRQSPRGSSKPRLLEKRQMEEDFVRQSCPAEVTVKAEDAFTLKTNNRDVKESKSDLVVHQWQHFLQNNVGLNEHEANVAQILAQILKTDSLEVIQHWLIEAPEKEKEVVLEMIRAASSSNLEFREVMNKLSKNPNGEDVETLRSKYEEMLDMKDVTNGKKSVLHSRHSPRNEQQFLDVIKENIEADVLINDRSSTRSKMRSTELLLPPLKREDAEIEALRSQLASRSNINVFSGKPSSRRSPR